jgi:hypothetical protein
MKKNKINQGHFLELMDRLDDAGWALAEAYQIIGQESIKNYEKNKTLSRRHKKPKD